MFNRSRNVALCITYHGYEALPIKYAITFKLEKR